MIVGGRHLHDVGARQVQAFCAGIDLREVAGQVPPSASPRGAGEPGPGREANGLFRFFPVIDKPVIGAINGAAVTGGLEVALQCTFLVASERARFADTHARVGIMPGGGITVGLARSAGLRQAVELSLSGNFLTAADALRLGLVNHVVAHEDLLSFTRQLARDIAGNDQDAVRASAAGATAPPKRRCLSGGTAIPERRNSARAAERPVSRTLTIFAD